VLVNPSAPGVVPTPDENRDSITDLPDRRIVVSSALGGVVGAALAGLAGWLIGDSVAAGVITAGFGAIIGAVIAAMLGGAGRFAGEQAWSQPHAPGRTMGVVAVFSDDDADAVAVVREMETWAPHAIRLVGADGAWRAPVG
jgi:hypothetical protein